MNKIYRLVWNRSKECWTAASEIAKSCGRIPSVVVGAIALMFAVAAGAAPGWALDSGALPTGGQIVAGSGSIAQSDGRMTVTQGTERMVANWSTFNIGQNASVDFRQPGASSIALNRIQDQNPTQILGGLTANGQIFLLNPSGIIFGQTAQVDVGGVVASTLALGDEAFMAGRFTFDKSVAAGAVVNQGAIRTADGGYVAFIGPQVRNEGSIVANGGSVLMAAGDKVSLDFAGDGLLTYSVEQGAVDALADNKGLLKADGGLVVMTAKAADSLARSVVNNDGTIEAQTLTSRGGRILLLSDMESGETIVSGRLDASAPNGGDGGFIETSSAKVDVKDGVQITTAAPFGTTGQWLIDPVDIIIAASGGNVTGSAIATALQSTNVTLNTAGTCTGVACVSLTGTNGDIFVNDDILVTGGTGNTTLTFTADRDIIVATGKTISRTGAYYLDMPSITAGRAIELGSNSIINTNNGSLRLTAGAGDTGAITQNPGAMINTGTGWVQLIADTLTLNGSAGSIYSNSNNSVMLKPKTASRPILIDHTAADESGKLVLNQAELDVFNTIQSEIVIGQPENTGGITIGNVVSNTPENSITFNNSVRMYQEYTGGAGSITINNPVASTNGNLYFYATNNILNASLTGSIGVVLGYSPALAQNKVTVTGSDVTVNAPIVQLLGEVDHGINPFIVNATAALLDLGGNWIGTGARTIQPYTATGPISLTSAQLGYLTNDTPSAITFGRSDGTGAITLGAFHTDAPLTLRGGTITQTGAWTLGSTSSFAAGASNITLVTSGNDFTGAVTIVSGNNVSLYDANTLLFGGASTVSGTLGLTATSFTQDSAATIAGGAGTISILADTIALNGVADSISGTGSIVLQQATASRPMVIGAAGGVGDFALDAAELATLANGFSQIQFGNSGGNLGTGGITLSGPLAFHDPVNFYNTGVGGSITLAADAAVDSQGNNIVLGAGSGNAGAFTQTNGATIAAGAGTITMRADSMALNGAANSISGSNDIYISPVIGTRPLVVGAAGAASDLALDVAEVATLKDGFTSIWLGGSSKTGGVTLSGALTFNDSLYLQQATGGSFTVNATPTVSGALGFFGGGPVALNASVEATSGVSFSGAVTVGANNLIVDADTGTATFSSTVSHSTNDFTVTADDVALSGNWTGTGARLLQPTTVSQTIGLAGATGTFALSTTELGYLSSDSPTSVTIGRSDGTGAIAGAAFSFDDPLNLRGGAITQTGGWTLSGTSSFAAGAGNNISLTRSTNNFTGAVSVVSGKDVSLIDADALVLGASTVSGNLTLQTGGALTQTGNLAVTGTTSVTAGANNITLTQAGNDFTGAVTVVSGAQVSVTDANSLLFGGASTFSGSLNVAAAAFAQASTATIIGTGGGGLDFRITADSIDLAGAANSISGAGKQLKLFTATPSRPVVIGDAGTATDFALDATELATLADGFSIVSMGHTSGTGGVQMSGSLSFKDLTMIYNGGVGGSITLDATAAVNSNGNTLYLNAGTGDTGTFTQSAGATITGISGSLRINADSIALNGAADSIDGSGFVMATHSTNTRPVILGAAGGDGDFALTASEIATLSNGFSTVWLGSTNNTAGLTVAGPVSFHRGVNLLTSDVSGSYTVNATPTAGGILNFYGSAPVSLNASVSGSGGVTFAGPVTVGFDDLAVEAGTGTATFSSTVAHGTNNFTVTADGMALSGNWTGDGARVLQPTTVSRTIGLGDGGTGTFAFSTAELGYISNDSPTTVTIGRSDGTGAITGGAFSFDDPLNLRGGAITQTGAWTLGSTSSFAAGVANDITLTRVGNDFGGAVAIVSGKNISITDTDGITIGTSNITGNLTVESLTTAEGITLSGTITKDSGADATLTFKAVGPIALNAGAAITSTSNKLNTILWADSDANGGAIVLNNGSGIATNGGNLWMGGGSGTTTWNGFTVGNGSAINPAAAGNGITLTSATISTGAGNIYMNGQSTDSTTAHSDGIDIQYNSTTAIQSTSGNITLIGTGGTKTGVAANSDGIRVSGSILSTTGDISLTGYSSGGDQSEAIGNELSSISSSSGGDISLNGDVFWMSTVNASIASSGLLTIAPTTAGRTIGIGGTGDLSLASAYFNTANKGFVNGFSSITVGSSTAGAITVGGATTLNDSTTLLNNSTISLNGAITANENLTLTSNGAITQSAAVGVTGTTSITAGAGNDITLNDASNNFTGAVSVVSGNNVSLRDANALVLGASTVSGNLTLQTGGALTQTGDLAVTGTTSVTAGANDITLTQAGNDFGGAVSIVSGHDVSLTDANALALGASTVSGNLTLQAGGALTQTGNLAVTGTTSITGGANDITLNRSGNNFVGAVTVVSGKNVILTDTDSLLFGGTSTVSGSLILRAPTTFTQASDATITATNQSITISADTIYLNGVADSITGQWVTLSPYALSRPMVIAADSNGVFSLNITELETLNSANVYLGNPNSTGGMTISNPFSLNSNLSLYQAVGGYITVDAKPTVSGSLGFSSTTPGAPVTLNASVTGSSGVNFYGPVTVGANNVVVDAGTELAYFAETVTHGGNNFSVTADRVWLANNWIGSGARLLQPTTTNRYIGLADGTGFFSLDATELGYLNNDSPASVTIGRADGTGTINGGAFSFNDPLVLRGGTITQTGAWTLGGTSSFAAGVGNNITLTQTGNDFTGTVTIVSGNNVSLRDANALVLGASTVSGNLTLQTGGALTQAGDLAATGTTSITAGANDITLDQAGNDFTGAVTVVSGAQVSVTDANSLLFGGASTFSGNLHVTAASFTQASTATIAGGSGALNIRAETIDLAGAANSISGTGSLYLSPVTASRPTVIGATGTASDFALDANELATLADGFSVINLGHLSGTGGVQLSGDLSFKDTAMIYNRGVGGSITLGATAAVNANGNQFYLAAGTGDGGTFNQTVGATITGVGSLLDISADSIALNGVSNSISGSGIVRVLTNTDTRPMILGAAGGAGDFALTANEIATLSNGFSTVWLGVDTNTAGLTVAGPVSFQSNVFLFQNAASGSYTVNATPTGSGILNFIRSAPVALNASVTGLSGVTFAGPVTVGADDLTVDAGTGTATFSSTVAHGSNDFTVTTNNVALSGNWTGTGARVLQPTTVGQTIGLGDGGTGTFALSTAELGYISNESPTSVTIGRSGGTGAITGAAFSFDDPLNLRGGTITQTGAWTLGNTSSFAAGAGNNITLDQATNDFGGAVTIVSGNNVSLRDANALALAASTVSGNLTLQTGGALTQTGDLAVTGTTSITAGANNITLTQAGNDFAGALSVASGADVNIHNNDAMTLGAVVSTGAVDIATLTGDLTISQNISTTSATATIRLNAGETASAGTSTGGNIVVSGSPVITTGGGSVTLFSGDVSESTGLAALVGGSGSGRFRYNSDESSDGYSTALASGANAIYRERPTVTVTADDETATYAVDPSLSTSASGLVNGDTGAQAIGTSATVAVGGSTSTSGHYVVGDHTLTASGAAGGLGYAFDYATGTLTVNKADLSVTGLTASYKTYNANATAALGGTAAVTALGTDVVTVGGTAAGTFADKNVDDAKAVTVTGVTIGGTDSGNYNLVQQTGLTADITKADLSVTGLTASDKTYNANATATLGGTAAVTALGTDVVTVGGTAAGTFADKNVDDAKAVTVTGVTIGGTDSGNYNLVQQTGLTADITKADLFVTGLTASDKTYNANTTATLGGTAAVTALGTDVVTVGGTAAGTFADKNVDDAKAVTVTGVTIGGTDSGNYNLVQQTGLTADITKADLSVTGLTANDKVYDGNAIASVETGSALYEGLIDGDVVTVSATGLFDDENVGEGKTVTLTCNFSGADAGNYAIDSQAVTTADISPQVNDQALANVALANVVASLTSPQHHVNGTSGDTDFGGIDESVSNNTGFASMGPGAGGGIFEGNDFGGLISDRTGYLTDADRKKRF